MKPRSILVLLVLALLVIPLAACGEDEGTTDTTAAATATTAAGTATTAAAGAPVGEQVDTIASEALIDAIAAGAKDDAVVRPLTGRVVSSATSANVYFVAMEFSSNKFEPPIAMPPLSPRDELKPFPTMVTLRRTPRQSPSK